MLSPENEHYNLLKPLEVFTKKCCICGSEFETTRSNKNNCSFKCSAEHVRQHARMYARLKRNKNKVVRSCIICGFSETTDLHRELNEAYILCPNHHCLITRGIKTINELLANKTI